MSVSAPRLARLCDIGFRIPLVPEAVIVDCLRTACGKAPKGTLRNVRPDELGAAFMRALLEKYPQVKKEDVEDVIIGCAMPEGEAGLNMARAITLRSGLPVTAPAMTIIRFCSSGLRAILMASHTSEFGSCISARTFAPRFFRIPPRDNAPALRYHFASIRLSKNTSPSSCRTCRANNKKRAQG